MSDRETWEKAAASERKKNSEDLFYETSEGLKIKALYSASDLAEMNYQESFPGVPPFSRGSRATMYTGKPWTIRQYAGFSTAEESNAFYRDCLKQGQKGLSVAFDLATHRGFDSDHPRAMGDVGKAGVAIDSVEDMKALFKDIPLDEVSVSMTMNGAVLPILACYIVAAEEAGVAQKDLSGTIQNDILKEYIVRNTYIYPPEPSMRIVSDIIEYTTKKMPRFNSISVSGYHFQEAGANSALELAYTLADGLEYIRAALAKGLTVDEFAPRISFFFAIGMNFFVEIAKLRAARELWCELVSTFQPKDERSLVLRTHCQTSGYTLTEQDPYNNIVRTTIEALAACLGGTQSLHTNSFDEAIALPSEFSARIARNTQLILQEETDITKTVDPLGGSYFIEKLTHDIKKKAMESIQEIERLGGMTKAILTGVPKMRIEESSVHKQAQIDSGKITVVGVNKYTLEENDSFEVRELHHEVILKTQIKKLENLKKLRDVKKVEKALLALTHAAKDQKSNLLFFSIEAIKARATIGEASLALEKQFGRYQAEHHMVQSIYSQKVGNYPMFEEAKKKTLSFSQKFGRRPRILIAKIGQDGHDRGAHVMATGLSDIGFDVDIGPLFQIPQEVSKQAVENDVHVIGVSTLAGGHNVLVPELIQALKEEGAEHIKVVVGGIVPKKDQALLLKSGVALFFGPGSTIPHCAIAMVDMLEKSLQEKRT